MRISAVIVTKGDRDITRVCESLKAFDEVIIWDNSKAPKDLKVFGRFAGAYIANNDCIYVQDDDCLIQSELLVHDYSTYSNTKQQLPVLCNFPVNRRQDYKLMDIALIGWGTIFHKNTLEVFNQYLAKYAFDDLFLRECDRIFSYLNRLNIRYTDVSVTHLDYAYGSDRMGREQRHGEDLKTIRQLLQSIQNPLRSAQTV